MLLATLYVVAQYDQSGFISIDCGIVKGSTYTNKITSINYVSDADFVDNGEIHSILSVYESPDPHLTTLTSFPKNNRSCYTLRPSKGKGYKYLIRARFMYGNYDFLNRLPEFDVYLGVDYWDTLKLNSSTTPVSMEIIHVSTSYYIHACLLNTGRGTPFVSAIELRLLGNNMYTQTDFGSLYVYRYADFGAVFGKIRYKPDTYDRLWSPTELPNTSLLYNSNKISSELSRITLPPSKVMSTAITPTNPTSTLNIEWKQHNTSDKFFVYLHFAELEALDRDQKRELNIYLKGNHYFGPLSPLYQKIITVNSTTPEIVAPTYTFTINKTKNSTHPPIISALELYTLKQLPQKQTYDQDVAALWSIKSTYGLTKNWQGDPCTPLEFVWNEVQSITNNFNVVIGKGGFGTLYHGCIGHTQVAVKMLSKSSQQGEKEFQAEVNVLLNVHHRNLTSFVGYCNEEKHNAIIYEYTANGNLERHLFGI
ncbi:hypothetical protein R6Q57_020742 [Mikania cordata]